MSEAGKGSTQRPFSISHEEWVKRWDAIFGRDLEEDFETQTDQDQTTQQKENQDGKNFQ